jgi:O-antigen/teichoic acid export membrane protein
MGVLESYSRVHMRIVIPAAVREIFLRLVQTLLVVLYFHKIITLDFLIYGLVVSYFIGFILLIFYVKHQRKLYLSKFNYSERKALVREVVVYGLFIFLGSASGLIASKIDVMMLSSYKGLFSTGIYSIAFFIGTVIEIPKRPIAQISSPLIAQFWKNEEYQKIEDIYKRTAINQLIVGLALFLLIWCNVDLILSLVPNPEIYKAGKFVILYIGLSKVIDMGTGANAEIIVNSPFYRINLLLSILSGVLIIGFNSLLIPTMGMDGAALAILINYTLLNFIRMAIIYKKLHIQPFTINILFVLLIGTVVYFLDSIMPYIPGTTIWINLLNLILRSILVFTLYIGSVLIFKLSKDFHELLSKFFLK